MEFVLSELGVDNPRDFLPDPQQQGMLPPGQQPMGMLPPGQQPLPGQMAPPEQTGVLQ